MQVGLYNYYLTSEIFYFSCRNNQPSTIIRSSLAIPCRYTPINDRQSDRSSERGEQHNKSGKFRWWQGKHVLIQIRLFNMLKLLLNLYPCDFINLLFYVCRKIYLWPFTNWSRCLIHLHQSSVPVGWLLEVFMYMENSAKLSMAGLHQSPRKLLKKTQLYLI